MNIKIQICGGIITVILMLFCLRSKRLPLPTNRMFMALLSANIIDCIFDILSLVAIFYQDSLPIVLVKTICKAYLLSLVTVTCCAFLYICSDVYEIEGRSYRGILLFLLSEAVLCVGIVVSPIYIFSDGGAMYTYGPSANFTYMACVWFFCGIIGVAQRFIRTVNKSRRLAVYTWIFVWVLAAGIQFMIPNLLVVSFAASLGVMILYLQIENPEFMLDSGTNLFNYGAFKQYVKYLYVKKKRFCVLSVVVAKQFERDMQLVDHNAMLHRLSTKFVQDDEINGFRIGDDEIYFVLPDEIQMERTEKMVREFFENNLDMAGEMLLRVSFIYLSDCEVVHTEEELTQLLHYVRTMQVDIEREQAVHVERDYAEGIVRREKMEQQLREIILEDRVEVFFQPIYSTQEKRFISAEALMRIRDADGKIISPYAYISIAEANGFILPLGRIIFEKVCRFLAEKKPWEYGLEYVEVNLSTVQCANGQLADEYMGIMQQYGINPKYINLEITESASMKEKKTLLNNMGRLIDYGVDFSLDDFGTGQSNLNYIVDMPVKIVKFDREMINAYFDSGKARFVMDAAMQMIHGMGLEIVAEGIETKEQFEVMEKLGIQFIQGYYFSRPLPAERFIEFIQGV